MSSPYDSPGVSSADDALPPVEPPSAGFLLQLFVIPAVIVMIIVCVYVLVFKLAHLNEDPQAYVDKLSRRNPGQWQAAADLADRLRDPSDPSLRRNTQLATSLKELLEAEIEAGRDSEEDIQLRGFLCRALGEFEVPVGLPVLIQAANRQQESSSEVNQAALEALALSAERNRDGGGLHHPELINTLVRAADSDEEAIRLRAAFAMGLVDDSSGRVERKLEQLMNRLGNQQSAYNATTALARRGNPAAVAGLARMLNPKPLPDTAEAGDSQNEDAASQEWFQVLVLLNALRATTQLLDQNPNVDLAPLDESIEKLAKYPNSQVQVEAKNLSLAIKQRSP